VERRRRPRHNLMSRDKTDLISKVLADASAELGGVDTGRLTILLAELFRWNPQLGLVSKHHTADVVTRLIRRSVHMWRFLTDRGGMVPGPYRVADVGSGGGFPGLLWKLLEPRLDMALIERKDRKAVFLERVILKMRIDGASAISADLFDLAREGGQEDAFDVVTLMAVGDPADLAGPVESMLKPAGFLCAVRGRDQAPPPDTIGEHLVRHTVEEREDGRYVLYKKNRSRSAR